MYLLSSFNSPCANMFELVLVILSVHNFIADGYITRKPDLTTNIKLHSRGRHLIHVMSPNQKVLEKHFKNGEFTNVDKISLSPVLFYIEEVKDKIKQF